MENDDELRGTQIITVNTLKSKFDNNCIVAGDDKGKTYRLPCSTIIQMLNEFRFKVKRKRIYNYLTEVI